jgi:hypothetical protein
MASPTETSPTLPSIYDRTLVLEPTILERHEGSHAEPLLWPGQLVFRFCNAHAVFYSKTVDLSWTVIASDGKSGDGVRTADGFLVVENEATGAGRKLGSKALLGSAVEAAARGGAAGLALRSLNSGVEATSSSSVRISVWKQNAFALDVDPGFTVAWTMQCVSRDIKFSVEYVKDCRRCLREREAIESALRDTLAEQQAQIAELKRNLATAEDEHGRNASHDVYSAEAETRGTREVVARLEAELAALRQGADEALEKARADERRLTSDMALEDLRAARKRHEARLTEAAEAAVVAGKKAAQEEVAALARRNAALALENASLCDAKSALAADVIDLKRECTNLEVKCERTNAERNAFATNVTKLTSSEAESRVAHDRLSGERYALKAKVMHLESALAEAEAALKTSRERLRRSSDDVRSPISEVKNVHNGQENGPRLPPESPEITSTREGRDVRRVVLFVVADENLSKLYNGDPPERSFLREAGVDEVHAVTSTKAALKFFQKHPDILRAGACWEPPRGQPSSSKGENPARAPRIDFRIVTEATRSSGDGGATAGVELCALIRSATIRAPILIFVRPPQAATVCGHVKALRFENVLVTEDRSEAYNFAAFVE